jgi:TPR repeat protein
MQPSEEQALREGLEAIARRDFDEFFRIHAAQAQKGSAICQYHLGWCYQQGVGCVASAEQAVRWWESAASQGDAHAQYALGTCLERGEGVDREPLAALAWYAAADEQGFPAAKEAMNRLARLLNASTPNTSLERTRER